jgi:hypothetical protein
MMADPALKPGCALCMLDGIWSKPIDNWPGVPICRECIAESIVRTGGHPVISPSPGFATASPTLQ